METFAFLKFYLYRLGILKRNTSSSTKYHAILLKCIVFGLCMAYVLITIGYVTFTARTSSEFTLGSVFTSSSLFMTVWFTLVIWSKEKFEKLFVDLDAIIQKSMWRTICRKLNEYFQYFRKKKTFYWWIFAESVHYTDGVSIRNNNA